MYLTISRAIHGCQKVNLQSENYYQYALVPFVKSLCVRPLSNLVSGHLNYVFSTLHYLWSEDHLLGRVQRVLGRGRHWESPMVSVVLVLEYDHNKLPKLDLPADVQCAVCKYRNIMILRKCVKLQTK